MGKGKLEEEIKESLKSNPDVVIVQHYSALGSTWYFPNNMQAEQHSQFVVAPKNGLYTVEELQKFMIDLLPDLEPTEVERFYIDNRHIKSMILGSLCFTEEIGKEITQTKFVVSNKELAEIKGHRNREETREKVIVDATFVYVYPNKEFATGYNTKGKRLYQGHCTAGRNSIDLKLINKHNPNKGLLKRLFSR